MNQRSVSELLLFLSQFILNLNQKPFPLRVLAIKIRPHESLSHFGK